MNCARALEDVPAEGSWAEFQQSVLGHLLQRLGRAATTGTTSAASWAQPTGGPGRGCPSGPPLGREFTVLSTVGMCRRGCHVERHEDDVALRASSWLSSTRPASGRSIFPQLAQYPWRSVTWFAPGTS